MARRAFRRPLVLLLVSWLVAFSAAQTSAPASTVPALIKFTGAVQNAPSKIIGITFALYKDQQGGASLWLETQSVTLDSTGHYSVQLGATLPAGLPKDLFSTGEARWLGVQPEGQSEQPRVLLLSVPYALKAADAETIGGLPPSAFVLAAPVATNSSSNSTTSTSSTTTIPPPNSAVTGLGTVNAIPLWDTTSDIVSSVVTQTGTGTTAKIGINTATPTTTLDVKGAGTIRGLLTLPSVGVATAAKGSNSQGINFTASAFSSTSNAAVNQNFRWQSEAAGNDTTAPSATMNLLFGSGTSQPAETGLKISNKGLITFADGQTFPDAGTITGVSVGPGLVGGGTSGNVTVSLTGSCGLGQVLQWTSVTWQCASMLSSVTAGTDVTVTTTNGNATVSLDTTQIPQLNAANLFTGNQTVSGNLSATGVVTGNSFQIGSNLFGYGSFAGSNAFLGFGGSTINTGTSNTATGAQALGQNTTGSQNTAVGSSALLSNNTGASNTAVGNGALTLNTTGSNNTATGVVALQANTTGSNNTANGIDSLFNNTTGSYNSALGYLAGPDSAHPALNNATAIGALATVTASNAIVLGSISGVNGAGSNTNVGIGTTGPAFSLDVHGTGNFTGPVTFAASQTFPNTISGLTAGTDLTVTTTNGNATVNLDTTKVPVLNASNSFIGNESVTGNVSASGNMTASGSINGSSATLTGTGSILLRVNQNSTGANTFGVLAQAVGPSSIGVYGQSNDSNGMGVEGLNNSSTGGFGVMGVSNATAGFSVGVWGKTSGTSSSAVGVEADAANANAVGLVATNITGAYAAKFFGEVGVTGDLAASGAITANSYAANSYQIGPASLAIYNPGLANMFLAGSGNTGAAGFFNTGVGVLSLAALVNANLNTAVGYNALRANTTGSDNTAIGDALSANTTGGSNIGIGFNALFNNTTGSSNTAVGTNALQYSTGNSNTALGFNAWQSQGNLSNATAIGAFAEVDQSNSLVLGSINGLNGATADTNVGIGVTAPQYRLHVGNGNSGFRVEGPATAGTNGLAASFGGFGDFGIDAPGVVSGRIVVKESGNVGVAQASPTHIFQVGQGKGAAFADSWSTYSSRRWKTNIQTLPDALAKVERLRGVSYDMKGGGKHEIGVIAEEVGKVVPEIVSYEENGKDAQGVDYSRLTAVLIEAVKEQQKQIQEQRKQIRAQQAQIARLAGKVGTLETSLHANQPGRVSLANRKAAATILKSTNSSVVTASVSAAR